MATWKIKPVNLQLVAELQQEFQVPEIFARVLAIRGIHSIKNSTSFFSPDLNLLHDPFLMLHMEKAAEAVTQQIQAGKKIVVFGDYDVDGTTGASMLYLFLKSLGADPLVYIPNREKEGYGLSELGVDFAAENGTDLLITCDCGINAHDAVSYANKKEIQVIITDHHISGNTVPDAYAILNPKQPGCSYPFKELCGGGVTFKLAHAVTQMMNVDSRYATKHLDLIALGTTADIVPIVDENRIIVFHGLQLIRNTEKPGLRALLDTSNLENKELTVGRLVYWIAPRINAAGRMGDANRAVKLLTSNDFFESLRLSKELDRANRTRQVIQKNILDEAIAKINSEVVLETDRAIVLWKEGWHPGIIGIVCSKIKEEYYRPVVIIAMDGNMGKGSARSITGFDLYDTLSKCSDLLEDFGGHPMAAGLNIQVDRLEDFRKTFIRLANESLAPEDLVNTLDIDGEMNLHVINGRFMNFLKKLAPYGPGNIRPLFISRNIQVSGSPRLVGNGEHLKFTARQDDVSYDTIGFNLSKHYEQLIRGESIDIVYVVEENEWKGQKTVQLNLRDIKLIEENRS